MEVNIFSQKGKDEKCQSIQVGITRGAENDFLYKSG